MKSAYVEPNYVNLETFERLRLSNSKEELAEKVRKGEIMPYRAYLKLRLDVIEKQPSLKKDSEKKDYNNDALKKAIQAELAQRKRTHTSLTNSSLISNSYSASSSSLSSSSS